LSGRFFTPDLTAFEHEWQDIPRLTADPVIEKSYAERRQAQREAVVRGTRTDEVTVRKELLRPTKANAANKERIASPVVTHAERSPKARVEKARSTCKERPEPDRVKRGRGSGKAFVPWCDRKRR